MCYPRLQRRHICCYRQFQQHLYADRLNDCSWTSRSHLAPLLAWVRNCHSLTGLAPTSNAFTNVRIREVLINEAGSPVANQTGIHLVVWYNGFPIGAPDLSYSNMTTDPTGTTSWSLATGTLIYNQRIFYVAHDGHASLSVYTCAQMQPTYT
jgi:hypothetical protein